MAFQKLTTIRKYYKYAECAPGQKLVEEGAYTGPTEGKFGVQHNFTQKNGENVTLNSSGHLNWLLENHVKVGAVVNVYYADKIVLQKGTYKGKEAHNFELEVDDGTGTTVKHADVEAHTPAVFTSDVAEISL